MFKKTIAILSFVVLAAPLAISAQSDAIPDVPTSIDLKNLPNNLPAPISDFVNKLKGVFENSSNGNVSISGGGPNINLSDAKSAWTSINEWFSAKIGISLSDIIKTVVNLIIWIWEIIIKLIQTGLSYL